MTGIEALQAIKDGKKVRAATWLEFSYIYFDKERNLIRNGDDTNFGFSTEYFFNDDRKWEVYEETVTLRELLGYTIRLSGRNYYVVPYVLQRMHLVEGSVPVVSLMPVDTISNPFSWTQFQITHKIPKSAIVKTSTDNGIAILDGE